jgi:Uma2 family endonuclease
MPYSYSQVMPKVTQLSQLDLNQRYSYADYLTWRLNETVELIKGKIMLMSPAPSTEHQTISGQIHGLLFNYFRHKTKTCRVFAAPFDVRLLDNNKSAKANKDIYTVVQPDLCVICDTKKLDTKGCLGAPDWIIEILSKGNSKREMQTKYELYAENGVPEYWIIYPYEQAVHQFVLQADGHYQLMAMYAGKDIATPSLFPDLALDLHEVFRK